MDEEACYGWPLVRGAKFYGMCFLCLSLTREGKCAHCGKSYQSKAFKPTKKGDTPSPSTSIRKKSLTTIKITLITDYVKDTVTMKSLAYFYQVYRIFKIFHLTSPGHSAEPEQPTQQSMSSNNCGLNISPPVRSMTFVFALIDSLF